MWRHHFRGQGKMKSFVCAGLFLLGLTVAQAQPVYKTVGPDGKISFSDEPPAAGKTTALEGYGPPPPKEPVKSASERAADISRQARARYEVKQAQAAVASPQAAPVNAELGQAIVGVLAFEDLVQQARSLCVSTLPTSFRKYDDAASAWRQRNADILKKARAAMVQALTAEQRNALQKVVEDKNRQQMEVVVKAPTASRIKWCDQSADEINRGVMDPATRKSWVAALANVQKAAP